MHAHTHTYTHKINIMKLVGVFFLNHDKQTQFFNCSLGLPGAFFLKFRLISLRPIFLSFYLSKEDMNFSFHLALLIPRLRTKLKLQMSSQKCTLKVSTVLHKMIILFILVAVLPWNNLEFNTNFLHIYLPSQSP